VRYLIGVALVAMATRLGAQTVPDGNADFFAPRLDSARRVETRRSLSLRSPGAQRFSPIASAIFPGSGQYMLGDDRFIAYVAVEVVTWLQYAKNTREQAAQEAEYKSLARRVARASFTTGSPDDLPDGDWMYYEKIRDWNNSGAFSLTVGGPLTPETDVTTYNGSRWQLAQATYATREGAIAEYLRTAVRPEYAWSWTSAQLEKDRYARMTDKRNDAHRAGQLNLMILGANHVLSMVDAFTTLRLRASSDRVGTTSIGAWIPW
jgi:hypothetical protein